MLNLPTWLLLILSPVMASAGDWPVEIEGALERAVQDDVPTAPLEQKATEGSAKGVPAPRVAAVLDQMRGEMLEAREVLGDVEGDVLAAAGSAHRVGVSWDAIEAISDAGGDARAITGLNDLIRLGLSEFEATRLVTMAVNSKDPSGSLSGLATSASLMLDTGLSTNLVSDQLSLQIVQGSTPLSAISPQTTNSGNNSNSIDDGNNGNHGTGNSGNGGGNSGSGNSGQGHGNQ